MTLPWPPKLEGIDKLDIEAIHRYLYDLVRYFPNAAGEAIDPTVGQGGDGALTVTEVPTNVFYTASSGFGRDGGLFGEIQISFVLPSRAVSALVYYREVGSDSFHVSNATTSPFALTSLKTGVAYIIKLAGVAANGNVGPFSDETTVVIPVSSMTKSTGSVNFFDFDEAEIPLMIPGTRGLQGLSGLSGMPSFDGEDASIALDGLPGPRGLPGLSAVFSGLGLTAMDGEDGFDAAQLALSATLPTDGVYTPTLTIVANLDAVTAFAVQWCRIGQVCFVAGLFQADPTVAATLTRVGLDLPIPSNFTAGIELAGTCCGQNIAEPGHCQPDTVNDRAEIRFISAGTTNHAVYFIFMYYIV